MRRAREKLKYCHTQHVLPYFPEIVKHLSIFTLLSFDFIVFLDCFIEKLLSKHLCKSKWLDGGIIVKSLHESSLYDAKYDC